MPQDFLAAITVTCAEIGNCASKTKTLDQALPNIADIIIGLIGGLSVIFILWGGLRYVISRGDPSAIKAAKETILYAVIGVIVAIISYAIVGFVANSLGN